MYRIVNNLKGFIGIYINTIWIFSIRKKDILPVSDMKKR